MWDHVNVQYDCWEEIIIEWVYAMVNKQFYFSWRGIVALLVYYIVFVCYFFHFQAKTASIELYLVELLIEETYEIRNLYPSLVSWCPTGWWVTIVFTNYEILYIGAGSPHDGLDPNQCELLKSGPMWTWDPFKLVICSVTILLILSNSKCGELKQKVINILAP